MKQKDMGIDGYRKQRIKEFLERLIVDGDSAASGTEARQRQDREDGLDPKGDGPVGEAETPND